MPRYIIRNQDGVEVNRIIAPAEQISAFCGERETAEMEDAADFTPEREARFSAAEARRQLAATDWYVTRFIETGVPIPEEVSAARAEWRNQAQ
jgi:hypothetical protein